VDVLLLVAGRGRRYGPWIARAGGGMAAGTAVDDVPHDDAAARTGPPRWGPAVPAGLAAVAAVAVLLPWWHAGAGPVLLGTGPLRELPADVWTGTEVAGSRAVVTGVLGLAALVAVAVGRLRGPAAAAAGGAAVAGAGAALAGWGPTGGTGVWIALVAGAAAVVAALRARPRRAFVPIAALVAAAIVVAVPGGPTPQARTPDGPFVPVAALGVFPLRSGAAGLAGGSDRAWPVVADGAPGIVTGAGVVVADGRGRARVLARTDRGAPVPLGVAGDRLVRWAGPDSLAVTGLRADAGLDVVVHDVAVASRVGADGSLWLRSEVDPPETVRRLDLFERSGEQALSATYLPVVTIQNPDGEGPLDVRAVLPVPGGALRVADAGGVRRLQRLTGTAAGIAVAPVPTPTCADVAVGLQAGDVRALTADTTGIWVAAGDRLVHLATDGTVRVLTSSLPGRVMALAEPGDGSLVFTTGGDAGGTLWRLPDPQAALASAVTCTDGRSAG
jgi:hypothetical protein